MALDYNLTQTGPEVQQILDDAPVTKAELAQEIADRQNAVSAEHDRATEAEQALADSISESVSAERSRATEAEQALADALSELKAIIPQAASESNKLADMKYVIDQIENNISAFKGQFTTFAQLQNVGNPKYGDIGIVRTKDYAGHDVYTFYQYKDDRWNEYYVISYHPQDKHASTGILGDYPYNGMGRVELPKNMVDGWPDNTWIYLPKNDVVYLLYSWHLQLYAVYNVDAQEGLGLDDNLVVKPENYDIADLDEIVNGRYLSFTENGGVWTIEKPDESTITSTELNNTNIYHFNDSTHHGINVLTQEILNRTNTNYIIQYDYDLNGQTITVPERCILKFDGGSLKNGTIIGQDTLFINAGDVDIWGENLTREGTWREHSGGGGGEPSEYIKDASVSTDGNTLILTKKDETTVTFTPDSGGGSPDKPYNPEAHSGLGRKTLELDGDSNILTQDDFDQENTIYVITYDFDLNGGTIEIPEGCILEFDGGSVSNGTLVGNYTIIDAESYQIFGDDLTLEGAFDIKEVYPEWFGAKGDGETDDTNTIQKSIDFAEMNGGGTILFGTKQYELSSVTIGTRTNLKGQGQGATILHSSTDFRVNNAVPDNTGIIVYPINVGISVISDMTILGTNRNQNGISVIYNSDHTSAPLPGQSGIFENRKALQTNQCYKDATITNVYVGRCNYGIVCRPEAYRIIIEKSNVKYCNSGIEFSATDSSINECYVESCSYNGISVYGGNNKITNIKSIWNGASDPLNCYGIRIGGDRHNISDCEAQDNYCSGIIVMGTAHTLTNVLANGDGIANEASSPDKIAEIRAKDNVDGQGLTEWAIYTVNTCFNNCIATNYIYSPNRGIPKYVIRYDASHPQTLGTDIKIYGKHLITLSKSPIYPDTPIRNTHSFNIIEENYDNTKGYKLPNEATLIDIPLREDLDTFNMGIICEFIPEEVVEREVVFFLFGFYGLYIQPFESDAEPVNGGKTLQLFPAMGDRYPSYNSFKMENVDVNKPIRVFMRANYLKTENNIAQIECFTCLWYYTTVANCYVYALARNTVPYDLYEEGGVIQGDFRDYKADSLGFRRSVSYLNAHGATENTVYLRKLVATYDTCIPDTVSYPGYPLYNLNPEFAFDYLTLRTDRRNQYSGPTEKRPQFVSKGQIYYDNTIDLPVLFIRDKWSPFGVVPIGNVTPEEEGAPIIEETVNADDLQPGTICAYTRGDAYKDTYNYPFGYCYVLTFCIHPNNNDYLMQLCVPRSDNSVEAFIILENQKNVKYRTKADGVWSNWYGEGGGGELTAYLKSASVSQDGNTLTLVNKNDSTVTFAPSSGGGGEPAAYIKSAVVDGNTLTLTDKSDTPIVFTPSGGGTQGTKVYLEENSGSLTTAMLTSQNVVYVISYDYTISETVTVPSGCSFEFAGGSINGGTLVLNNTYLYGNIKFGADITISGTCKNDTAYQKWFANNNVDAWHRFINNIDGVTCYEYSFGVYSPTVYVTKEVDNKGTVLINGNNAVLRFPYSASTRAFSVLPKSADTYTNSSISQAVSKGDTTITVENGSLFSAGDIVSVRDNTDYSFSPHRSTYKHCEFATVSSVSGNVITLSHPVYGTYQHLDSISKVYKFNYISCYIRDLTLSVSTPSSVVGSFIGIAITQAFGGELKNVVVNDFRTNIILYSCGRMSIEGCSSKVNEIQDSGSDSYGMSFAGCQNINVIGGDYVGGNHAVSIGGANNVLSAISREILIKNIRAKSIKDGFPCAIDMHGCAEFVTIEGCETAGIYLRGKNNKIINNFVYDGDISCGELASFNHTISGNILKSPKIAIVGNDITDREGWIKDCTEDIFVVSDNSTFDQPYTENGGTKTYELKMFIASSIEANYYNIGNTTLIVENNNVRNGVCFITGFDKVILKNNVFNYDDSLTTSITSKPKLTCTKLFVENNKFFGYGHNPTGTSWSFFGIGASYVYIRGNIVESVSATTALFGSTAAITEMTIEGNTIKDKFVLVQTTVDRVIIRDNTIEPAVHGVNISKDTDELVASAFVLNNIVSAKKSIIVFATKLVYGRNVIIDSYALTQPHVLSTTTLTNLDS